ncbi:MAG TPA: bifunctional diguanylate cyclase/phosphodiesterase, partial [Piscirickettsiaceae bacterium]|nr:bifunctional diguanylate cyclase/phosphodiesterase [Piscirickettsiaceae bacterium]
MDKPLLLISPDPAAADTLPWLKSTHFVQAFNAEQSRQLMASLQPDWILSQPQTWGWPLACVDAKALDYDALTGLLTRQAFTHRLEERLHPDADPVILLLFSIDRFSNINDSFGLAFGDAVLKALAQRLHTITRQNDWVARLGGDLFAILVNDVQDERYLRPIAERFFKDLSPPLQVEHRHIHLSYSLGAAHWPTLEDTERLLNGANRARLNAKRQGGHQIALYTPEMNVDTDWHLMLENHLRYALKKKEIELWLQPQVDSQTRRLIGAEALVRWRHPRLGVISPAAFLPIAEQIDQIAPITDFVLRTLIHWSNRLHDSGHTLQMGLNLTPQQFQDPKLLDNLQAHLEHAHFPLTQLEIEVVESQAMEQLKLSLDTMKQLKALGLKLALDDFGTGHSSLAWLSQFPVNTLKIDQSFIRQLPQTHAQKIIHAIIALAKSLSLKV